MIANENRQRIWNVVITRKLNFRHCLLISVAVGMIAGLVLR
jgi:hypothetical protein